MGFKITFLPRADEGITEAVSWYESRQKGLGKKFLANLDSEIDRIKNNPAQFRKIKENFRQAILRKFPFVIIYRFSKEEIIIHSVFNTYRNPNKKF